MACPTGKKVYNSQGHALTGALSASRKTGAGMRAYRCNLCPKWHLTKTKKR